MPSPQLPQAYILFDGTAGNYVEIPDPNAREFSFDATGELTISVWTRPDNVDLPQH